MLQSTRSLVTVIAASAALTTAASADHLTYYTVDIQPLNGSNVTGNAVLTVDSDANTLTVNVSAFNLEPNQDHLMHIHGLFDMGGAATDSTTPTLANDTDGDGYVEVLEGLTSYGDILLPLATQTAPDGSFNYVETLDLGDDSLFFSPVSGNDYAASDIFPLNFRELVIHGQTVASGEGAGTDGEVNGAGGYIPVLPIAAGEIIGAPIPEPGSLALLGLGGLALAIRRRRG